MVNNTSLTGTSLSAYVSALLAKSGQTADAQASASKTGNTSAEKTAQAALATAARGFKASSAHKALEAQQTALGTELRAALAKSGVTLGGAVEFTVGSKGEINVTGSDKDKAAVTSFLKNDGSKPSFSSRIADMAGSADELSGTIRQSAAISQAARYAGHTSNVMSLYTTLMQQQDTTSAKFSVSSTTSALTYPGVLASKA